MSIENIMKELDAEADGVCFMATGQIFDKVLMFHFKVVEVGTWGEVRADNSTSYTRNYWKVGAFYKFSI